MSRYGFYFCFHYITIYKLINVPLLGLDRKAKITKNNFASLFILKSFVKVLKFKVNWVDMYFNKTQRY